MKDTFVFLTKPRFIFFHAGAADKKNYAGQGNIIYRFNLRLFLRKIQVTIEIILKLSPIIFNKLQLREEHASKNTVLRKMRNEKLVSCFTRLTSKRECNLISDRLASG